MDRIRIHLQNQFGRVREVALWSRQESCVAMPKLAVLHSLLRPNAIRILADCKFNEILKKMSRLSHLPQSLGSPSLGNRADETSQSVASLVLITGQVNADPEKYRDCLLYTSRCV